MPTEDGRYTTSERASYDPGPCPYCGRRTLVQQWANARGYGDTQDWWLPSRQLFEPAVRLEHGEGDRVSSLARAGRSPPARLRRAGRGQLRRWSAAARPR